MANFIEKLGLEFLTEDEEAVRALWTYIYQNGNAIRGYYGSPYMNLHIGNAQFILRTVYDDSKKCLRAAGMDTHAAGNCVWNVRLSGADISRRDADIMERRCIVCGSGGEGMAVVNIVNADVLPGFGEGETLRLQMIAFPWKINYYADEDEYAEAQPKWKNGKLLLADGTVVPTGLLKNRDPESDRFDEDDDLDDMTAIRGTVKALYHGYAEFDGRKHEAYIRCIIDTQLGELEIVHTIDDVREEQRGNMNIGAVVDGVFTLSGDAAIYEYENGMILDEAHDLAALRAVFMGENAERVRNVFADGAVYRADTIGETYEGRVAIIERLKFVAGETRGECFAYPAVLTSVDGGGEELPYKAGKDCVVLAYGENEKYTSIAFIDVDENGRIARLVTSSDSRYRFTIEKSRTE